MKIPLRPTEDIRLEVDLPIVQYRESADGTKAQVSIEMALLAASLEVNRSRVTFRRMAEAGEMIGDRWDTHPDRAVIKKWLEEIDAADDDFRVLYFIASHVITEWLVLPKHTTSAHKKLYSNIQKTSLALKGLLQETGEIYYRGGGHGLKSAFVCDLFTEREANDITRTVEGWNESHPEITDDGTELVQPARTMFPTIEELLDRLASAARRIESQGPVHSQPNKRGALNGYFIRRMGMFLLQRYGEAPTDVLAAMATIALDVVMDDDLAKKNANLSERSRGK